MKIIQNRLPAMTDLLSGGNDIPVKKFMPDSCEYDSQPSGRITCCFTSMGREVKAPGNN
jgi:hypothetical protein